MIRKIVLSNFMAHVQTELELADGLNVIVGPNNIGKSSIAVALKILARNSNSNFVMQHDQKECSVTVETGDGHTVQWLKRKSPSYRINGQAKDRLGRGGTPPELDETLRLASIEFEDKDFEPHFGDQKSPIFLINRPPSQIAQFFSTTSDAEKLVAMQRLHQRQRSDAQTQSKLGSDRNQTVLRSIDALATIPELEYELGSLEQEAMFISDRTREIADLESLIGAFAGLLWDQHLEDLSLDCLRRLPAVPPMHATEVLENLVDQWSGSHENEIRYRAACGVLFPLTMPPSLKDEQRLTETNISIATTMSKHGYWKGQLAALEQLTPPVQSHNIDGLRSVVLSFEQSQRDAARSQALLAIVKSLVAPLPVSNEAPLVETIAGIADAWVIIVKNEAELKLAKESLVDLSRETELWLKTEPQCGTCGAQLSADSIRFRAHPHEG